MFPVLLLFIHLSCCKSSTFNVTTGLCSNFTYNNLACVLLCPNGSTTILATCELSTPLSLFSVDFTAPVSFSSSAISNFQTLDGSSFTSSSSSMIPTAYQGFYSAEGSSLVLKTSYIPAPDLTLKLWIMLLSPGIIFNINSTETYLQLSIASGFYSIDIMTCNTGYNLCGLSSVLTATSPSNLWENLILTTTQASFTSVTISIIYNYSPVFTTTLVECENSVGISGDNYSWYIGNDSSGFRGFIYSLQGLNGVDTSLQAFVNPPSCLPDTYWDGVTCAVCSYACGTWPWCIRSTCNLCYSTGCTTCTGFDSSLCTAGGCSANCLVCTSATTCTQCSMGFLLTSSACALTITASLLSYTIPTGMISGANKQTYYQYNPEADDPFPQVDRGFYFEAGTFLSTDGFLILPNNFTVFVWIKGTSGAAISKGSGFEINYAGQLLLTLQSQSGTESGITFNGGLSSTWNYLVYMIVYSSFQTTITQYVNTTLVSSSTHPNLYFQDASQGFLYLGKSSTSSYEGFIAQFAISTNMTLAYSYLYALLQGTTALSPCPSMTVASTCAACLSTCTYGCINIDTCTTCADAYCSICSSGSTGSCTLCSGDWWVCSNKCSYCAPGTSGYNCICYPTRGTGCYVYAVGIACNACIGAYSRFIDYCVTACPTGTTATNNECQVSTRQILHIEFANEINLGTVGVLTSGYNDTNVYPDFDIADPIPVHDRGWFFSSNSSLSSNSTFLAPVFAISMWIKIFSSGDILSIQPGPAFTIFQDSSGAIHLQHTTQLSPFSLSSGSQDFSTWRYLSVISDDSEWLNANDINIKLELVSVACGMVVNNFYDEQGLGTFVIGSTTNTGFTGFLYTIEIYSEYNPAFNYQTVCPGCSHCPLSGICLSECNVTQIDSSPCGTCFSNCTEGCVRTTDCYLCSDPLCYSCTGFSSSCLQAKLNAQIILGIISCIDGSFKNATNDCQACHPSCSTCIAGLETNCTGCTAGYRYFSYYNLCIPAKLCTTLPGGIAEDNQSCTSSALAVFSVVLTSLQNSFTDTVSNIPVSNGNSKTFYPDYDSNDPWVADFRGYYFAGSSFLTIGQGKTSTLLLGPEMTIATWINIYSDGTIFQRIDSATTYFTLRSNGHLTFQLLNWLGISVQVPTRNLIIYSSWMQLQIHIQLSSYIAISIKTNLLGTTHTITLNNADYFQDSPTASLVYGGNPGFVGFIWSINIYNSYIQDPYTTTSACIQPSDLTSCISNCNIAQMPLDCEACSVSCTTGCNRINSCNLCHNYECETCIEFDVCTGCVANATLVDGVCACNAPRVFDLTVQSCQFCYTNCEVCYGMFAPECLQCSSGYYFVLGYCMLCPSGYVVTDGQCTINDPFIFQLDLNTLSGVLYDTRSKIPVLAGNSQRFYPNYDESDPFAAYLRGFYFNGNSSFLTISPTSMSKTPLILGPNWLIELWILPNSLSGCIISSISDTSLLYSLCLSPTQILLNIFLSEFGINQAAFSSSLPLNSWSELSVSIGFAHLTTAYLSLNSAPISTLVLSGAHFVNYFNNTSTLIGCTGSLNFYQGFIYQISMYAATLTHVSRNLADSSCSIQLNNECIPDCKIDSYWEGPYYNNCSACPDTCIYGCRTNSTCSLCSDPGCVVCSNYNSSACESCVANSYFDGICRCNSGFFMDSLSNCVSCESNQYFDGVQCSDCPGLCETCGARDCYTCANNSAVVDGGCVCNVGYAGNESCVFVNFTATGRLDQSNSVVLDFSSQLKRDLLLSDFSITINDFSTYTYALAKWTETEYCIKITYTTDFTSNCNITIIFLNQSNVESTNGGFLLTPNITLALVVSDAAAATAKTIAQSEATSSSVTTATTSASVGIAMMNPNPASLWSFINTVQMLCYIELSSIELPPKFKGYLKGLKKYNMFPNVFSYFLPRNGGQKPFAAAYEFGFTDNLLLFNSGSYLTVLFLMFCFLIFTLTISKFTHIKPFSYEFVKKKIETTLQNYKYGAFIRFWITCYLDIMAASLIAIMTTSDYEWGSLLNLIVACVLLVLFI